MARCDIFKKQVTMALIRLRKCKQTKYIYVTNKVLLVFKMAVSLKRTSEFGNNTRAFYAANDAQRARAFVKNVLT